MTERYVLAIDLDDTLLRSDKQVSPVTAQWLQRWLEAGHEIVVATGRPPRAVPPVLPACLQDAAQVVYNGAQIIEAGEVVYNNPMPAADVRTMVAWAETEAPNWFVGLEIEDQLYLNRDPQRSGSYVVTPLQSVWDQPTAKLIFFFPNGREDITPMLAAVPPTSRALVSPKFSMVQLCASNTDKANALEILMRRRQRSLNEVVAIGDDVNDTEMVRRCGIGVAMANALPEVIAAANWTTRSNDEEGVAVALQRLLGVNTAADSPVPGLS